jgi:opacity protein-like surface antigen
VTGGTSRPYFSTANFVKLIHSTDYRSLSWTQAIRRVFVVTRMRLLAASGLAFVLITAVVAQEKKDPPPPAKTDAKKDEVKKDDAKKDDAKKDDTKKDDTKKDATPAADNPLSLKFVKDTPFWQEMLTKTIQNIKVQGLDVGQNQEQTFTFKFDPKKQEGDKWIVQQTIEAVKMKIDIAGSPVSYDSTNENAAAGTNTALSEFFKALKGSQFTLTIGKDCSVEKVEGREEFIKKLVSANKQLELILNKILGEEAMKQMADPCFGVVPKEPKKVGDKWSKTVKLSLGPLGSYENIYNYTYAKQTGDTAEIDVTVELKYTTPAADQGAETLPFKIKGGKIEQVKDEKANRGKVTFNTKAGRVETANVSVKMTGSLTLDIGGTTTEVSLTQDQTTELKSFDKSPIQEKK